MRIKNRPYFVRADKWEDFLNHKTDDETLERCKRIDRMINMGAPVIKNRSEDMEHREIKGENMGMRLIDANMMAVEESEAYISAQTSGKINPITQGVNSVVHRKIQQLIADTPTVDPETLPVVQKLRKELARVTAERDAAVKTIFEWTGCPECKQWDSDNEWCMKHDREPDSSDGCNTPEWRGTKEG